VHAAPPLAKSLLISSYSSKKCLAKINVGYFKKWFTIYFYCWWVGSVLSISPCQLLHAVGYPFDCPNIVCLIAFPNIDQTPKQNYPSQPEKISRYPKENEPDVFLNKYPYTNLAYNVMSACIIIWWPGPQLRGRLRPPGEMYSSPKKMSWTYCMHNHCSRTCFRCKICASLRKLFAPPGVPSWLRVCWWLLPCDFCSLCHSAQSFHNQIFQVYHQIVVGEINVKSLLLE